MCEDPRRLLGWRVPAGCRRGVASAQVAACRLPAGDWPRLREFFSSRYTVGPLADLPADQAFAVSPRAAMVGLPPRLQVWRRPDAVELLALAGDVTAPTD